MDEKQWNLIVTVVDAFVSLFAAGILFGVLKSTGLVKNEFFQLGGAGAGFVVVFLLFERFYNEQQKAKKPMVTTNLIFTAEGEPVASNALEVILDTDRCTYEVLRFEGEKAIISKPFKMIVKPEGRSYSCMIPVTIKPDQFVRLKLIDKRGHEWVVREFNPLESTQHPIRMEG